MESKPEKKPHWLVSSAGAFVGIVLLFMLKAAARDPNNGPNRPTFNLPRHSLNAGREGMTPLLQDGLDLQSDLRTQQATIAYWQTTVYPVHSALLQEPADDDPMSALEPMLAHWQAALASADSMPTNDVDVELCEFVRRYVQLQHEELEFLQAVYDSMSPQAKQQSVADSFDVYARYQAGQSPDAPENVKQVMDRGQMTMDRLEAQLDELLLIKDALTLRYGDHFPLPAAQY